MVIVEVNDGRRRKLVSLSEAVSFHDIANAGTPNLQHGRGDTENTAAARIGNPSENRIASLKNQGIGRQPVTVVHRISKPLHRRRRYNSVRKKMEEYQDAYDKAYGTVAVSRREDKEAFLRISRSLG